MQYRAGGLLRAKPSQLFRVAVNTDIGQLHLPDGFAGTCMRSDGWADYSDPHEERIPGGTAGPVTSVETCNWQFLCHKF